MANSNRIGRINLTSDPSQTPLRVDLERFLAFSYAIAEDLQDLVARIRCSSAGEPRCSRLPEWRTAIDQPLPLFD